MPSVLQKSKQNTEAVDTHVESNNMSGSHKQQKKKSIAGLAKVGLAICIFAALLPHPHSNTFLSVSDNCPPCKVNVSVLVQL